MDEWIKEFIENCALFAGTGEEKKKQTKRGSRRNDKGKRMQRATTEIKSTPQRVKSVSSMTKKKESSGNRGVSTGQDALAQSIPSRGRPRRQAAMKKKVYLDKDPSEDLLEEEEEEKETRKKGKAAAMAPIGADGDDDSDAFVASDEEEEDTSEENDEDDQVMSSEPETPSEATLSSQDEDENSDHTSRRCKKQTRRIRRVDEDEEEATYVVSVPGTNHITLGSTHLWPRQMRQQPATYTIDMRLHLFRELLGILAAQRRDNQPAIIDLYLWLPPEDANGLSSDSPRVKRDWWSLTPTHHNAFFTQCQKTDDTLDHLWLCPHPDLLMDTLCGYDEQVPTTDTTPNTSHG